MASLDPRQLLAYYNRLAPRERLLVGLATFSVVGICLYSFVWDPLNTSREQIVRRINSKEKDLSEIQRQREVYLDLKQQVGANDAVFSTADFNLFAYVQNEISQAVSKDHIVSMNPSNKNIGTEYKEEMVEIKLQQLSLPQVVDLMYRIEKGQHPLRFSRLQVKKRFNDIWNFDVNATVSVLKTVGAS